MDNNSKEKKVVSVEFDEEQYKQLNEIVDYLQSHSISFVTRADVIRFLVSSMYKNEILGERRK